MGGARLANRFRIREKSGRPSGYCRLLKASAVLITIKEYQSLRMCAAHARLTLGIGQVAIFNDARLYMLEVRVVAEIMGWGTSLLHLVAAEGLQSALATSRPPIKLMSDPRKATRLPERSIFLPRSRASLDAFLIGILPAIRRDRRSLS
jgi:hypothetical protein